MLRCPVWGVVMQGSEILFGLGASATRSMSDVEVGVAQSEARHPKRQAGRAAVTQVLTHASYKQKAQQIRSDAGVLLYFGALLN